VIVRREDVARLRAALDGMVNTGMERLGVRQPPLRCDLCAASREAQRYQAAVSLVRRETGIRPGSCPCRACCKRSLSTSATEPRRVTKSCRCEVSRGGDGGTNGTPGQPKASNAYDREYKRRRRTPLQRATSRYHDGTHPGEA
jgi:hypothetical protein